MLKLYGEKCLFMNFHWMCISRTLCHWTNKFISFYFWCWFPVFFFLLRARNIHLIEIELHSRLINKMTRKKKPFNLFFRASNKNKRDKKHYIILSNDTINSRSDTIRFICVAVTFRRSVGVAPIVFHVGIQRTSRQFMIPMKNMQRQTESKSEVYSSTYCLMRAQSCPTKINVPFEGNKHH